MKAIAACFPFSFAIQFRFFQFRFMAAASPSYAAKVGGLDCFFHQISLSEIYWGENTAIHSVRVTVDGLVTCTFLLQVSYMGRQDGFPQAMQVW